jgi:hypothetical protein
MNVIKYLIYLRKKEKEKKKGNIILEDEIEERMAKIE